MRSTSALLSTMAAVVVILGLAVSAAGATPGSAVYSIQTSYGGVSHSYTVTETVSTGSNASTDTLFLAVAWGSSNFTYSRAINSSLYVQPFLPAISNQSYTYDSNGTSLSANIASAGTVPVTFNGQSYKLSNYAYSVQGSGSVPDLNSLNLTSAGTAGGISAMQQPSTLSASTVSNVTFKLTGTISAFPSGLVYSVRGSGQDGSSFTITLVSTTLPLSAVGASATVQVASAGVGAGVVISALALALGVRHRQNKTKAEENKPEHWVD